MWQGESGKQGDVICDRAGEQAEDIALRLLRMKVRVVREARDYLLGELEHPVHVVKSVGVNIAESCQYKYSLISKPRNTHSARLVSDTSSAIVSHI